MVALTLMYTELVAQLLDVEKQLGIVELQVSAKSSSQCLRAQMALSGN